MINSRVSKHYSSPSPMLSCSLIEYRAELCKVDVIHIEKLFDYMIFLCQQS